MCVVAATAAEQQQNYHDDQNRAHLESSLLISDKASGGQGLGDQPFHDRHSACARTERDPLSPVETNSGSFRAPPFRSEHSELILRRRNLDALGTVQLDLPLIGNALAAPGIELRSSDKRSQASFVNSPFGYFSR